MRFPAASIMLSVFVFGAVIPASGAPVFRHDLHTPILSTRTPSEPVRTVIDVTTDREDGQCFPHQEGERFRTRDLTEWSDGVIEEGPWSAWTDTCLDPWTMDMSPSTAEQVAKMSQFEQALVLFPEVSSTGLVNAIEAAGLLPDGWSKTANNSEVNLGDGSRLVVGSFSPEIVGIRTYSQPSDLCVIRVMHRSDGTGVNGLKTKGGQVNGVWTNSRGIHPINNPGQQTDKALAQYYCGTGLRVETYVYVSRSE